MRGYEESFLAETDEPGSRPLLAAVVLRCEFLDYRTALKPITPPPRDHHGVARATPPIPGPRAAPRIS